MRRTTIWLGMALTAAQAAVAQDHCNGTFELSNAQDAKSLRESCEVVVGNITIDCNFNESINLDGIREVQGSLAVASLEDSIEPSRCDHSTYYDRKKDSPSGHLELSSSTLEIITGGLSASYLTAGLGNISLPALKFVGHNLMLQELANVRALDITNLETVGFISLGLHNLEELRFAGLKEFTNDNNNNSYSGVLLDGLGNITNIDGFFKAPLHPELPAPQQQRDIGWVNVATARFVLPDTVVPEMTFGWTRAYQAAFSDVGHITLGGPETETMSVGDLQMLSVVGRFDRAPTLKNLTVDKFILSAGGMTHLDLPFDSVSDISIDGCANLTSIRMPDMAKDWVYDHVYAFGNPNLILGYEDGQSQWIWPQNDMVSVRITANMTTSFFDSFIANNIKVSERFKIHDISGKLNCSIFANITDRLPGDYSCSSDLDNRTSGAAMVSLSTLLVWLVSLAVVTFGM